MPRLADHIVTIDLTFPELEGLLKTVGIAINNLLSKLSRVDVSSPMHAATNSELLVLVGIQQSLMECLTEASIEEH